MDLTTGVVWALAVSAIVLAFVKFIAWSVLMEQSDQTMVGVSLKRQKAIEGVAWCVVATLCGMSLITAHYDHVWGLWTRVILRITLAVSLIGAALTGVQFVYYLIKEIRRDREDYI